MVAEAKAPASFSVAPSVYATSSSPGNVYTAGSSVVLTAPTYGDVSALGGSVISAGTVSGDALLIGGSLDVRSTIEGDIRALGGTVTLEAPIKGDLVAFGYTVDDSTPAGGSVLIAALNAHVTNGAQGAVTIYGNTVTLGGVFDRSVTIISSGRVTLLASTTIHGMLSYESPEPATIPTSATIDGGVRYTNAAYLPTAGTSRMLMLLNLGFFMLMRFLGTLLLAGLLAGLFPRFAEGLVERALGERVRSVLLTISLGFGIIVATPILIALLTLTFIGVGIAMLLFIVYALLLITTIVYAGVMVGGLLARRFARREAILWRDGVTGMFVFSLLMFIPIAGAPLVVVGGLYVTGVLLQEAFHFLFPGEERYTAELL